MIRHIFIAPIKDGISEEKLNKEISLMRAMKDNIPEIIHLTIGKNTGWVGGENAVTMVVDLKDKASFDIYMKHPYHAFINSINGTEDDCFVQEGFYSCQIEYEALSVGHT